jgi:uncharacterized membrane protein
MSYDFILKIKIYAIISNVISAFILILGLIVLSQIPTIKIIIASILIILNIIFVIINIIGYKDIKKERLQNETINFSGI